jgi:hypothetical protein
MEARILRAPPESGSIVEIAFDAIGTCAWVLVEPDAGLPWAGVFGHGAFTAEGVWVSKSTKNLFVIAGGDAYMIDCDRRQLLWRERGGMLVSAVAVDGAVPFVASDYCHLYGYGSAGRVWRSRRLALDGIRGLGAKGSQVVGEACVGDWHPFAVASESGTVECGPDLGSLDAG